MPSDQWKADVEHVMGAGSMAEAEARLAELDANATRQAIGRHIDFLRQSDGEMRDLTYIARTLEAYIDAQAVHSEALAEALRWYANIDHWGYDYSAGNSLATSDAGKRARAALTVTDGRYSIKTMEAERAEWDRIGVNYQLAYDAKNRRIEALAAAFRSIRRGIWTAPNSIDTIRWIADQALKADECAALADKPAGA